MRPLRLAFYAVVAAIVLIGLSLECFATPQVYVKAICGDVPPYCDYLHYCGSSCHQCNPIWDNGPDWPAGHFDISLYLQDATHRIDGGWLHLIAAWNIQVLGMDWGEWLLASECAPWVSVHKWFFPPEYTAIEMEFQWPATDCADYEGELHIATLRCRTRPNTCDWVAYAQWYHTTALYHWTEREQVFFEVMPLPGEDNMGFQHHVCFVDNLDYGCCPPPATDEISWGDIKALYQGR